MIDNEVRCREAAVELGVYFDRRAYEGKWPKGCVMAGSLGDVFFNLHPVGGARVDATPVCLVTATVHCKACPAGKWASETAVTSCSTCAPGRYATNSSDGVVTDTDVALMESDSGTGVSVALPAWAGP